MNKSLILGFTITLLSSQVFATSPITASSTLSDQASYTRGYLLVKNNAEAMQNINLDAFVQGITTASQQQKPALSQEQMEKSLEAYKQQGDEKEFKRLQQLAQKNSLVETVFLAENAKRPNIQQTKSGLQYQITKTSQGAIPTESSTVTLNYEGRLADGTVFDSSIARQQPATFKMSEVIQGLNEGLQHMKVGEKAQFFVPSKLGYGEIGSGSIEPNNVLIFDVELLKVE